jgi:uncharacterized protein (DUF58 family)
VELCAVLAFSAIKNNDRVGLIVFTSEVEKYIPPKKGKNHVLRVIRELLYFKPRKRGTDVAAALGFLNRVQRKRSVAFLVSDFLATDYEPALRVVARHHDCIAVSVADPRERQIPGVGLVELEDPETGETLLVDADSRAFRESFAREAARRHEALVSLLRSARVDHIEISTDADYVEPVIKFFKRRERILS